MAQKTEKVLVPDLGGADNVDVIEVLVAPGDAIKVDDPIVTLEGEKATMEIPSPLAGVVDSIAMNVGDKASEGDLVLTLTVEAASEAPEEKPAKTEKKSSTQKEAPAASAKAVEMHVPDIGDSEEVDVADVLIKPGDVIKQEDAVIILEGEKATMEVPAPFGGTVESVKIKVGDKASEGTLIAIVKSDAPATEAKTKAATAASSAQKTQAPAAVFDEDDEEDKGDVHAGPGVRRTAHEFGVDLNRIKGSGAKGRIVKEDVQKFVKAQLKIAESGGAGLPIAKAPKVDFAKFGDVETKPLSKIQKISGANLHRNWVSIPHVTQLGHADITEMEAYRQSKKAEAAEQGFKLTPLVFIMKAVVAALKEYPNFNASLDSTGENLVLKKYFHIGVAVDTPNGLVVPVVRDVDQKSILDLAKELGEISKKARDTGIGLADMQGGCFTISSLGGIGGTAFTPIINAPEVAILGVSKSAQQPVFENGSFVPRLMLPLSLSYDHRVVDGADGARFIVSLAKHLADVQTLLS